MATVKNRYPSKISAPSARNILIREKLFKRIDDARQQAKVVWISAPGGSGKTTLLSSYIQSRSLDNIWYQIGEGDEDPATFFYYMNLAAKKLAPRKKFTLPDFSADYLESLPAFTQHYFEQLSEYFKNDGVIVFDNYQNLSEKSPTVKLLKMIISSLNSNITLIVISRSRVPNNLVALVAKRGLVEIGVDQIRFNESEWLDVSLSSNSNLDKNRLVKLHNKMDGWIAGLILCQYGDIDAFKDWDGEEFVNETLFNYFAEEFFSHLDEQSQTVLLRCSFIEQFSEASAKTVSGIESTASILENLLKKNYFIQKNGSDYVLHPLFQSFLQAETKKRLDKTAYKQLLFISAEDLISKNAFESASAIYIKYASWDLLIDLTISSAENLYKQGRIATLKHWLDVLPQSSAVHQPWLDYWRATLQGLSDIAVSQDKLEQVFDHFMEIEDEQGAWKTWLKAMEQINSTWREVVRLKSWLNKYELCRMKFPRNLAFSLEAQIVAELAQGYMHSGHDPKRTSFWLDQLDSFINQCQDPELLTLLLSRGMFSCTVLGFMRNAKRYLVLLKETIEVDSLGPLLQMNVLTLRMHNEAFAGDPQACLDLNEKTQALFKQYGVHFFEGVSQSSAVVSALAVGNAALAKKFYHRLEEIKHLSPINELSYCWGKTQYMSSQKRYKDAIEASNKFIELSQKTVPMPVFELIAKMTLIDGYKGTGQMYKVAALLDELLQESSRLNVPSVQQRVFLMKALFAKEVNDTKGVIKYLKGLFKSGQKNDMRFKSGWPPAEIVSWACITALKNNIEVEYLQRFIHSLSGFIIPPGPDVMTWPWPIRIYALGSFFYKLTDVEKKEEGIKNNRPIQLLRLLVLNSGSSSVNTLVKVMHPNLDSKKGLAQIRKHLHRLRALLGQENAILREGENLIINKKLCWLDVDAFEVISQSNEVDSIEAALELYRGEYLASEPLDDVKLLARREHLRSAFIRLALIKLNNLETADAILWCHDVLRVEPISELFYQKLMLHYQKSGQFDLAQATYDQCRRTLQTELGVEPMIETSRIASIVSSK